MIHKDLPFSMGEYERRLTKTRQAMNAAGIDVLFITDPSNQNWLTGYDGWSFYVHQGVLVFLDEDPIWWGRRQDANGGVRTVWMSDDRVRGYLDHFVQSTVRHPMQDLAACLRDMGRGKARVGVEMDNYYFSAKAFEVLEAELGDATFSDATALVNWQRGIKSSEEISFIRKAAAISEKIVDGLLERVEPGVPKTKSSPRFIAMLCAAWTGRGAITPPLSHYCHQAVTPLRRISRGTVAPSQPAKRRF